MVHYCEHCGKHYLRIKAAVYHESICFHNPENLRPCLTCAFLQTKQTEAYVEGRNDYTGEQATALVNVFHCRKKDLFIHLPQNTIKGNAYELTEYSNVEMPKLCDKHELMIPEF